MSSPRPRAGTGGMNNVAGYRDACHSCRRPRACCYCSLIAPFESQPRFVILSQPREAKHRFGTGRMAHLCLSNSLLLEGVDFSADTRLNRELENPTGFPMLLYPAKNSVNLTRQSPAERMGLVPRGRQTTIFVLDGTWKSVRKMLRVSPNLARLPMICFEPPVPSNYRIRRQPQAHCYSTLESIHHVLHLLTPAGTAQPAHDNLLSVFRAVIDHQLTYTS